MAATTPEPDRGRDADTVTTTSSASSIVQSLSYPGGKSLKGGFQLELVSTSFSLPVALGSVMMIDCNNDLIIATPTSITKFTPADTLQCAAKVINRHTAKAIKFSPDNSFVLCVAENTIDCHAVDGSWKDECRPRMKEKGCALLGAAWTSTEYFVAITTHSVEMFQVKVPRIKQIKSSSVRVSWFSYWSSAKLLVVCVLKDGSSPQLDVFDFSRKPGDIPKAKHYELDATPFKSDITVVELYKEIYIVHFIAQSSELVLYLHGIRPNSSSGSSSPSLMSSTSSSATGTTSAVGGLAKRIKLSSASSTTINAESAGKVVLQVFDNLLLVNVCNTKLSMIVDIRSNTIIVYPKSLQGTDNDGMIDPYSKPCSFLPPNFVIDTRTGSCYQVVVNLEQLAQDMESKLGAVDLLQRRTPSIGRLVLLNVIKTGIMSGRPLKELAAIFSHLCRILADPKIYGALQLAHRSSDTGSAQEVITDSGYFVITQHDIHAYVFTPSEEAKHDSKYLIAVFTEYIRALCYAKLHVEPFMHSRLIQLLVTSSRFYQLHQLLQYHVIGDSAHVACLLLSLESKYPPAYQLAIDMLKRLNEHAQILEVLLSTNQVIPALKFLRAHKQLVGRPLRFYDAAVANGDPLVFHTVYQFFAQGNKLTAPEMEKFQTKYQQLFLSDPSTTAATTTTSTTATTSSSSL
ncbi:regulator of MON1-CCZ1 complex [Pelomyxa schiedti]|nr:regulator of MON1-CCZ1 complex [Pelomyxa schiedti]